MARMLGRVQGSHCPSCHEKPGVDCADKGTSTRHQKRIEDRAVRAYVSRLWAEDWDCPEDAVYDTTTRESP